MIECERVRLGQILITEESSGHFVYGPVVLIDLERQELGIKVNGEIRSFPAGKLWTIPAFIKHKMDDRRPKFLSNQSQR